MRSVNGRVSSRPEMSGPTRRELACRCRQALYAAAAENWLGTRAGLRRRVRELIKPMRARIAWMLKIVSEARFAALVAGAVMATGLAGRVPAAPIELSDITAGTGGFAIDGEVGDDISGFSVSEAGDVNGDGLSDLIIGALYASPNGSESGRSYVVFGKADGTLVQLSDIAVGSGGFAIDGEAPMDWSGVSVSTAGDVNGDGLDDLIVGANLADANGELSGRSYVVFGKVTGTLVQLSDIVGGDGGFAINGEAFNDRLGYSVSGAGDVNGDGLADLIVGAYAADPNSPSAGRTYVVFGKATGMLVELSDVTAGFGGFSMDGEAFNDDSGQSVSAAGDVNGDGLADLIVGAPDANTNGQDSGRSYVVFGKAGGTPVQLSDITAGSGGFAMDGRAKFDRSGASVSAAGDVDGDGLADLLIGAWGSDPYGIASGRSYVIFGKTTGTRVQLSAVTAGIGGFAMNGEAGLDYSGESVSGAGDINGDGLADLIVGAWGADTSDEDSGRSYVVFGKATATLVQLSDVTAGTGGFVIDGEVISDLSGASVSSAGDVNGDGLADLIVGAFGAGPNGSKSGRSYVVFSNQVASASGTYLMKTLPGDGTGGMVAPVTDFGDVARAKIDFSDDDMADNGAGGASAETVTITRSNAGISSIIPRADVANVFWQITTDRTGFADAKVTLKYLDSEIAGISGPESDLVILTAPTKSGPWVQLASIMDAARNEISVTVTGFSFFVIGNSGVGQQVAAEHWAEYEID